MEIANIEFIETLLFMDGKMTFINDVVMINSSVFGRRKTFTFDILTFECVGEN